MPTSFRALPTTILEQCADHLNEEAVSQMALVSKHMHLATRYARSKPKHMLCTPASLDQKSLSRCLEHILSMSPGGEKRIVPPLGSLTYAVMEQAWRYPEGANRKDTVIQIMRANKGIDKFTLRLHIDERGSTCTAAVLSSVRELAAAAQRTNSTCKIEITDARAFRMFPDMQLDAKVSAILRAFPQNDIDSLKMSNLCFRDLGTILQDIPALSSSLKSLQIHDCRLGSNDLTLSVLSEAATLTGLEELIIINSELPLGLITGSAPSLLTLTIDKPGPIFDETITATFGAHFPKLHRLTVKVDEALRGQRAVKYMLLNNNSVVMPVLRMLHTTIGKTCVRESSYVSILSQLPSLRSWTLHEWLQLGYDGDSANGADADLDRAGYLALVKACGERGIKMSMTSTSEWCYSGAAIGNALQRVRLFQNDLRRYELKIGDEAFNEAAVALQQPMIVWPELRKLSLTLNLFRVRESATGGETWGDNLMSILRRVSAPKCEEISISFAMNLKSLKTVMSLYEQLVSDLPGFPGLARITSECRVGVSIPADSSWTDFLATGPADEFGRAHRELQKRTGIDISGVKVYMETDRQF